MTRLSHEIVCIILRYSIPTKCTFTIESGWNPNQRLSILYPIPWDVCKKVNDTPPNKDHRARIRMALNMMKTSNQMSIATSEILYGENTFEFLNMYGSEHFIQSIGSRNLQNVKHVRLSGIPRSHFKRDIDFLTIWIRMLNPIDYIPNLRTLIFAGTGRGEKIRLGVWENRGADAREMPLFGKLHFEIVNFAIQNLRSLRGGIVYHEPGCYATMICRLGYLPTASQMFDGVVIDFEQVRKLYQEQN